MKFLLGLILLLSFNVFSAQEKQKQEERKFQTTTERAEDMFRKPSNEDKGKIPEKYQPIDHKIKTNPDKESE